MPKHEVLSLLLATVIPLLYEGSLELVHPENVIVTCRAAGNRVLSCMVSNALADMSAAALLSCSLHRAGGLLTADLHAGGRAPCVLQASSSAHKHAPLTLAQIRRGPCWPLHLRDRLGLQLCWCRCRCSSSCTLLGGRLLHLSCSACTQGTHGGSRTQLAHTNNEHGLSKQSQNGAAQVTSDWRRQRQGLLSFCRRTAGINVARGLTGNLQGPCRAGQTPHLPP